MAAKRAVIDMGSNGIRFSITDLSLETARVMPTLYQDRAGISLYDAQWSPSGEKTVIPPFTIKKVIQSFLRFKYVCQDFGVAQDHVRVIATEATRQAINSEHFREEIRQATGWTVEMLSKEEEGRIGAMGIASSFADVRGLVMDLGGGSTQITWIITNNGIVCMSEKVSVSMPYGAAALTQRLSEADKRGSRDALRAEICRDLRNAIQEIEIPQELRDMAASSSGLSLYLSGGGFRGWGYLLLHQHAISPYPIPIINGFHCTISDFQDVQTVQATVAGDTSVFRISKRRASQVPAVAFLISCLSEALPAVRSVHFAQGGVRDGCFFSILDSSVRAQHPLAAGTRPGCAPSSGKLFQLMQTALPPSHTTYKVPRYVSSPLLEALAQSMYTCAGFVKDIRAASALRSTTTGLFASIHGLSHEDRAALAVALCERWDGVGALSRIDREFHARLMRLLEPEVAWWCMFLGRVGALVAEVYPSGIVRETHVVLRARWIHDGKDKHKRSDNSSPVLRLDVDLSEEMMDLMEAEGLQEAIDQIGETGKKKNRPDGHGYKVDVGLVSKHVQH